MTFSLDLSGGLAEALRALVAEGVRDGLAGRGEPWLDTKAAAEYLGLRSEKALRDLVHKGRVPFRKTPGGRLVFRASELDAWVMNEAA